MTQYLRPLSFIAAFLMATQAIAQDTTEATDDAAATEEAEPITEENAEVGQGYLKDTFGDWRVRCVRAPLGQEDPCDMFVVVVAEDKTPVSEFSIGKVNGAEGVVALATVRMPLEVLLPPGVEISIDGNPAGRVPFLFCTRQFCQSEIQLRDKDVGVFKRGGNAALKVVVRTTPPQEIDLSVSLKGFTKAYDNMPVRPTVGPAAEGEGTEEGAASE